MNDRTARCHYEVRVSGRLSRALRAEFAGLGLAVRDRPVETVLYGPVVDQAALYGLLRRIEALGLELVEVRRVPADRPPGDRPEHPPTATPEPERPPGAPAEPGPRGARRAR
ncbi:MAG TPA: hypothetical protein VIL48_02590 [Acidimicrobiales bacterium]